MKCRIELYVPAKEAVWNSFLWESNTPILLFDRQFMAYHQYLFADHSLLFFDEYDKLVALFAANVVKNGEELSLFSHQGLTFGGFITKSGLSFWSMRILYESLFDYCKQNHIKRLVLKQVPHFLQRQVNQTEEFILQDFDCKQTIVDINSVIDLQFIDNYKILAEQWQQRKLRNIKKAKNAKLVVRQGQLADFQVFWGLLESNLQSRFGLTPVHTSKEIGWLAEKFADKIRLFVVLCENEMIAGTVLFDYGQSIHAQYIASNEVGKSCGAIDFLFATLLEIYLQKYKYFSLGISNTRNGAEMNLGLLEWKQGWGAGLFLHKTFVYQIF
jgi:hypothetical protein